MKALVIANGCIENVQVYKEEILAAHQFDFIICADGGIKNTIALGLMPDLIIGDLDSTHDSDLERMIANNIPIKKYPKEKDQSDTELVLDYLIEHKFQEIIMIGCLGNRMDHSLANIYLLKKLLKNKITGHILDEKNDIYLIDEETEFIDKKDRIVSLIPFSDRVEGITSNGLYYSLEDAVMVKEEPYGISNLVTSNNANVRILSGELLILLSKD